MLLIVMTTAKTCHINCQKWMQSTSVYNLYSIIQLLKHDNRKHNLFIFKSQIYFCTRKIFAILRNMYHEDYHAKLGK